MVALTNKRHVALENLLLRASQNSGEGLVELLDRRVLRLACRQPCRTPVALVKSTSAIGNHLYNQHPYGACLNEHGRKACTSITMTLMMVAR